MGYGQPGVAIPESRKKYDRDYRRRRRRELMDEAVIAYGGGCTCCGEDTREFLTLEHVDGIAGARDRLRDLRSAKRDGWPRAFTILCFNCNCAKGIYGVCPHQNQ